jgi:hypothetical protein
MSDDNTDRTIEEKIRHARNYLAKSESIQGHGGSAACFGVCCALFRADRIGFTAEEEDFAWSELVQWNRSNNVRPSWDETTECETDSLRRKFNEAMLLYTGDAPFRVAQLTGAYGAGNRTVNDELRRRIVESGQGIKELVARTRTELPEEPENVAAFMLNYLFPGDPCLCVAKGVKLAVTQRKSTLKKPFLYPQIVPSPMSAVWGINLKGKPSQRCLNNTGPRTYFVCEFDLPPDVSLASAEDKEFLEWAAARGKSIQDISAALLDYLAQITPLVAVVDSGGKSLHGWYNVQGWDEKHVLLLKTIACKLGADPQTYTKCQLVRMPGGIRRDQSGNAITFQDVLYFDAAQCAASGGGQ